MEHSEREELHINHCEASCFAEAKVKTASQIGLNHSHKTLTERLFKYILKLQIAALPYSGILWLVL